MEPFRFRFLDVVQGADWGAAFGADSLKSGGLAGAAIVSIGMVAAVWFLRNLAQPRRSSASAFALLGVAAAVLGVAGTFLGIWLANRMLESAGGSPSLPQEDIRQACTAAVSTLVLGGLVLAECLAFAVIGRFLSDADQARRTAAEL